MKTLITAHPDYAQQRGKPSNFILCPIPQVCRVWKGLREKHEITSHGKRSSVYIKIVSVLTSKIPSPCPSPLPFLAILCERRYRWNFIKTLVENWESPKWLLTCFIAWQHLRAVCRTEADGYTKSCLSVWSYQKTHWVPSVIKPAIGFACAGLVQVAMGLARVWIYSLSGKLQ